MTRRNFLKNSDPPNDMVEALNNLAQIMTKGLDNIASTNKVILEKVNNDSTVQYSTVQYSTADKVPVNASEAADDIMETTEDEKMQRLKAQQMRLCNLSKNASQMMQDFNDADNAAKEASNDEKVTDTEDANNKKKNAGFLKILVERINKLEAEVMTLNKKYDQTVKDNKELSKQIKVNQNAFPKLPAVNHLTPKDNVTTEPTTNKKAHKPIPVMGISPGEGERDNSEVEPPMSFAFVATRGFKKKKQVPQTVLDENPNIVASDPEDPKDKPDITEEDTKIRQESLEESAKTIGLRPITEHDIDREVARLHERGLVTSKFSSNDVKVAATKNLVTNFLKHNLCMDEATRNKINIKKLFMNNKENPDTVYIRCDSKDDIAMITSNATKLPKHNDEEVEDPSIVTHIPNVFFKRFQECEELLWQIRKSENGIYQTNLRLGKNDLILRFRRRDNPTRWNKVAPMAIPKSISLPETTLYKRTILQPSTTEQPTNTTEQTNNDQMKTPNNLHPRLEAPNTNASMNGTITNQLKQNKEPTKRKITPIEDTKKKSKVTFQPSGSNKSNTTHQLNQPNTNQQLPKPTGPPGPTITNPHIQPTGRPTSTDHPRHEEMDTNVVQLFQDNNLHDNNTQNIKGYTFIQRLEGPTETSPKQVTVTKITKVAITPDNHE